MSTAQRVTVIVACYNVDNYLERCFGSILKQSYAHVEILAIDDGSSDNTKNTLKSYARKHTNFRALYNKENRGQGYSRNLALKEVRTELVAFVDADDWIEPNFIEELHASLVEHKADVSVCDIYIRHDNSAADHRVRVYDTTPNTYGLINSGLAASSCNKLYKTKVFKNLEYPENLANDDIEVVLAILYNYKSTYTDKTYYSYYQRPGSTQNGNITAKRLEVFISIENLKRNVKKPFDEQTLDAIIWHQVIALLVVVVPRARGLLKRRAIVKQFCELAKKHDVDIATNKGFDVYINQGRQNRLYGNLLRKLLVAKQYTASSFLMGCFHFYVKHKHQIKFIIKVIRLPVTFLKNPRAFIHRVKSMVFRTYVIKKNITLQDIVAEAKRQAGLSSDMPVSVVIPNYNYERFMFERIYSILSQTKKIGEILILDDNSTDGSVRLATQIKKSIAPYVKVRLINNKVNQGTFNQWKRGFRESTHDLVWIAEADDYSAKSFLAHVLEPLKNPRVILSYVDTGFVEADGLFVESVRRHIDYQRSGHWDRSYTNDGTKEVMTYSYLNNTVANVSSVVFRKRDDIDYESLFAESSQFKQAGDWVFYLNYMLRGDMAYVNQTVNYYRMHGSNVSASTKAKNHLEEVRRVYALLDEKVQLSKTQKRKQDKRIAHLKKAWGINE